MRVRTAVVITTLVGALGGSGIAVAAGATPWSTADLPTPSLTMECPSGGLELGESASLSGILTDATTGEPIPRHTVQLTRDDMFGEPGPVGEDRTTNQGEFGPLTDTPVNRGDLVYEAAFAGNAEYAPATATCDTVVHGTDTTITTTDPAPVAPGEDLTLVGTLTTAAGDPVSDATITATDTAGDETPSELPSTSTDGEGGFTVTVPDISSGSHTIDISYAGDPVLEPATKQIPVVLADDTVLTLDAPTRPLADEDLVVTGELATGSGEPVADAEITATDTVDATPTELTAATTDSAGAFAITVPNAVAGVHRIDVSYAGGGGSDAATQRIDVEVKHETTLTIDGPDALPAEKGPMTFTFTLTDGAGAPVADALLSLDDGGDWLRSRRTNENGTATYKKFGVTNEVPLRIDVTYAGDSTHWETSTERTWKAVPRYSLTKDQRSYVAGQAASLAVTTPDQTLPTTIELKPYRRPAIAITPSGDSNTTQFARTLYRNSTLTVRTEATEEYEAGSRTFTIRVAPRVTQTLTGSYDRSGDTYLVRTTRDPRLDAKLRPARPGRCVQAVVQKYVDGRYRTVQTSRCRLLDAESTASFKLVRDPRAGARFRMRFVSPADDMNIAGRGHWVSLRFTR